MNNGSESEPRYAWVMAAIGTTLVAMRAVSVSGNWRVTFRFVGKDADAVDYEDYH